MIRPLSRALALVLVSAPLLAAGAQTSPPLGRDVLHGHVTTDSGAAVAGAEVTITMAPDRTYQRTRTDSSGYFEVVFEHGTGDYLVHVTAPGMETVRKRVTRSGSEIVAAVDVALTRTGAQQLAAVNVRARKPKPNSGADFPEQLSPGAAEHDAEGVIGSVSPDLAGNLGALAGTIPGVIATSGGGSVAGLPASQNSVTLNGLGFAGADIPRDARMRTRVSTSTYDPARGWFGGFQEQVELFDDAVGPWRNAHLTLDTPALQYTDPTSRALGGRFTSVTASMGGVDRMHYDRVAYNYGISASHRTEGVAPLLGVGRDVLTQSGIAPDSIAPLASALASAHLPSPRGAPLTRATDQATFILQIGKAPTSWLTFEDARSKWYLLAYGSTSRRRLGDITPSATAASSVTTRNQDLALQLHASSLVRDNVLAEGQTGISITTHAVRPDTRIPAATLLLGSSDPGAPGGTTVVPVTIGGSPRLAGTSDRWTWESSGDVKLYPAAHPTHRLKLSADARIDGTRDRPDAPRGSFTFQSIAEVAANRPSAFTRTMDVPDRSARAANAFVALGDWWRASESLDLLYGLRLEGTHFLDAPADNPVVQSAFGVGTDHVPGAIGLSPRVGFTWKRHAGASDGVVLNTIGYFHGLASGTFRGGFGEFRSFLDPSLVSAVRNQTGLATGQVMLTCLGAAAPAADWSAYAADQATIPSQCAGGAASVFADLTPGVALIDPAYRAPRSWRGNLSYTANAGRLHYTIDGVYSLNLDQPGRTDLDFSNVARFTTADEGRTVFVAPASIVTGSGDVAAGDARRATSFGHVFDEATPNRSVSRAVTVTLFPELDWENRWFASASYTLARSRAVSSGFDGATFDSPIAREWARGDFDVRHQIVLQGGVNVHHLTMTLFGRVQSGLPYTPLVGSDVNGDGLVNDRAFIFGPASAPDTSVTNGLRSLLAGAPSATRGCLERQLGRPAARNSCEGPWTAILNAQLLYGHVLPITKRWTTFALFFDNPLGGLDQALHGAEHLHGWGTFALPDPVLYRVRGFDPAANRFLYSVNSRFGDTRPSATTVRAPFSVTLDISFQLGIDPERGFLNRWMRPGRNGFPGPRLPAATIKRTYDRILPDPYRSILEESDSLMLTRAQVDSLKHAQLAYRAARDSVTLDFATYLAGLGDTFDAGAAVKRQRAAMDSVTEIGHVSIRRVLPTILDRVQLRMLPYPANRMLAAPDNVHGGDALSPR